MLHHPKTESVTVTSQSDLPSLTQTEAKAEVSKPIAEPLPISDTSPLSKEDDDSVHDPQADALDVPRVPLMGSLTHEADLPPAVSQGNPSE